MTTREFNRRLFLHRTAATAGVGAAALITRPPDVSGGVRPPGIVDVDVRPEARRDPTELTIAEAATLIRHRQLTAVRLVRSHLERITTFDPVYLAFNQVLADAALRAARKADRQR